MGKPINNATVEMLQNLIKDIKANYIKKDDIDFYVQLSDMPTATEKYGGTWELVSQGRTLIGASDNYPLGSIGGEATHALTIEEMPSHYHSISTGKDGDLTHSDGYLQGVSYSLIDRADITNATGGNQPHNNMPPYLAVNIWHKISD